MSIQRKNETGMALIVAIFVTVFLLFISSAFFISSINSTKQSVRNWTGIVASEVCNIGTERALWNIQQRLDADEDWVPSPTDSSVLLYGDYDNFVKNRGQDTYQYMDFGTFSSSSDKKNKEHYGAQLYAVKLVKRDDPKTTTEEWMICSAGISRLATPDARTVRNVSEMEVLVQLGRIKKGEPKFPAMIDGAETPGEIREIYNNTYFHLEAMKDGKSIPAEVYTEANWKNTDDGNTNLSNRTASGRIGYAKETSMVFQEGPEVANGMSGNTSWDALVVNKGIKVESAPKMEFPEIDFDVFKNGRGNVKECDYKASDLVAAGLWEDKGDYYEPKKKMMYLAAKDSSVATIAGGDVYKDKNEDGYTVICTDKGFKLGTQTVGKIYVENGAHGVILSEGGFTSTGNAAYGNSQDAISNVGVDIRAEIHSVGGPKSNKVLKIADLNQGILPGGNQALADYKLGVKYPSMEEGGEYNIYGIRGAAGDLLGCIWEDQFGNTVEKTSPSEKPLWNKEVGILDIMSTNNVIISNPYEWQEEGVSRFRGSIYSKNKLFLQADLAMMGAIAGKKGVMRVNQWNNKNPKNGSYGGYDFVGLYENPLGREGITASIPENAITGSGGEKIDKRQMVLLAWNVKK